MKETKVKSFLSGKNKRKEIVKFIFIKQISLRNIIFRMIGSIKLLFYQL